MTFYIPKKALLMCATVLKPQQVFSTALYSGNNATQVVTTGLDIAGKGGLIWTSGRDTSETYMHQLFDTDRGIRKNGVGNSRGLVSHATIAESTYNNSVFDVTASGFSAGVDRSVSGRTYVAWSFRRAKKFFDTVTYTGNGVAGRQIPHGLGDVPGMIVVKNRSSTIAWQVWHRSVGINGDGRLSLNATSAATTPDSGTVWGNGSTYISPTASNFAVSGNSSVNSSGETYVAYLFAHNPDLIQCGKFTGNDTVTLGWRPQFVMTKSINNVGDWVILDTARGWAAGNDRFLSPNSSAAENASVEFGEPTATGFTNANNGASVERIYLAIRSPT